MTSSSRNIFLHPVFQGGFLLLLFIGAYFVPFSSLFHTWMSNGDYSYGILIPFISAYFLWENRQSLKGVAIQSCWPVFPVLLFFILLSIYGVLGSSGNIARPALPVLIILFAIFCFGMDLFKRISFPLCFLIFMIPLPAVFDRTIGVYLKTISSHLGGMLLQLLGYSVYVSGNVIDLGVTKLQVVDACSGLRFLFPLLALGVLYGYIFQKVLWKRVACVLVTIPIAIFTNILRIVIAGVLTYNFGSEMAEGFFHDFQGWVIFMVAFVFIFLFGRFLRFFPPTDEVLPSTGKVEDEIVSVSSGKNFQNNGNKSAFVVSVILLIIVGGLTLSTRSFPPVKIKGGIKSFPLSFNGWKGQRQIVAPKIIDASGAEGAFSGVYFNRENRDVSLYIGYRSTAFLENTNFFHSPTVCLPSSGWKTISKTKHIIHDVPVFKNLPVTEMVMSEMGTKQLVYFWFQTKNSVTYDKNINRFHLALHAIRKDNTYDLFIRPITTIEKGESVDDARLRMDGFVREMMGTLATFLKENQIIPKQP